MGRHSSGECITLAAAERNGLGATPTAAQMYNNSKIKSYGNSKIHNRKSRHADSRYPYCISRLLKQSKKATVELFFGWLNGMLGIAISWTRKVTNQETAQSNGSKEK